MHEMTERIERVKGVKGVKGCAFTRLFSLGEAVGRPRSPRVPVCSLTSSKAGPATLQVQQDTTAQHALAGQNARTAHAHAHTQLHISPHTHSLHTSTGTHITHEHRGTGRGNWLPASSLPMGAEHDTPSTLQCRACAGGHWHHRGQLGQRRRHGLRPDGGRGVAVAAGPGDSDEVGGGAGSGLRWRGSGSADRCEGGG